LQLVGAGSDPWTPDQWLERVESAFADANSQADAAGKRELKRISETTSYRELDVTADGQLAALLGQLEAPVAVYFALPPHISQEACAVLTAAELPAGTRLVMEKPFGSSEESARHLNQTLGALVPEDHIHRVDHFLGKATVLNILGLRFANTFLEPVWNRNHIEKVEIIFDEDLALEGRARYYDGAGALRDMIQSHLLQIMALLAMERPPPWTSGTCAMPLRWLYGPAASRRPTRRTPAGPATRPEPSTAGRSRTMPRKRVWTSHGTRRPLPRCRLISTIGAGRAFHSSSGPARPWEAPARRPW
ncbi:glucose-6-phosphate 1-dehydrogenase, cytoplasmic isoform 2, partial [Arthrobacter sp. Hiyo6]